MATILGLPKLSPTMDEGVLAKWNKKEGDKVSPGDVIAEVETDKANMDFVLEDEGTILKQLVKEGETVKLGAPVLILGKPGEDIAKLIAEAGKGAAAPAPKAEAAKAEAKEVPKAEAPKPETKKAEAPRGSVLASPLAKTMATDAGLDLRTLTGTGPGGRIVERDVKAALAGGPKNGTPASATPQAAAPAIVRVLAPAGQDVDKPLSQMRKAIAKRMTESKTTAPHFYLTSSCDAEPLMSFRTNLNAVIPDTDKVSVNDLIIKALALALRRVPEANASFLGDAIRYHGDVHIGVAVALDEGLITPVVRNADQKGVGAIHAEMVDLATRARQKKLKPEEFTGSTFSLSNLGMYGLDHFQAVLNPPEAGILAVGAVKDVPVVKNGAVVPGKRLALTLSIDHRSADGAIGARLLQEVVKLLEHPEALAL